MKSTINFGVIGVGVPDQNLGGHEVYNGIGEVHASECQRRAPADTPFRIAEQLQEIGGRGGRIHNRLITRGGAEHRRGRRAGIAQQALILEPDHPGELLFPRNDRGGRGSWGRDDWRGRRRHAAGRDQRQRSDDRE